MKEGESMKRKIVFAALLWCVMIIGLTQAKAEAKARQLIFIGVDDELIANSDIQAYIEDEITYVPVRIFAEALGVEVRWNKDTRTVQLTKDDKSIMLDPANNRLTTDAGEERTFSIQTDQERVVAPYRFLSEYFGFKIVYIQEGPIARVVDGKETLTNEQFLAKYKAQMQAEKEKWLKMQQPKPTKSAYLTFDDGPNKHTETILQILKEYEAKATFFMLDGNMKQYESTVQKMSAEGHALACHGVTHDKNKFYRSPASAVDEMTTCLSTIKAITNVDSNMIRVPYGSVPYMKANYRKAMDEAGYLMWDWNVDSLDWKFLNGPKTANYTIEQIKKQANGTAPIILMHDKATTAEALPAILDYLQNNGYELKVMTNTLQPYNFWNKHKVS